MDTFTNRITVILYPNTERAGIIAHGKKFNNERYCFSRKKPATGHEERMLKRFNSMLGITKAEARGQEIYLDILYCTEPHEWVPKAIEIVKEFLGPDYSGDLYLDDRREEIPTRYDEDGYMYREGTKIQNADIGLPYKTY